MTKLAESSARRARTGDNARDALLAATAEIAHSQGLAAITIQAVIDRARITRGCLFHHFPTKEALIDEMVVAQFGKLDDAIALLTSERTLPGFPFTGAYIGLIFGMAGTSARTAWDIVMGASPSDRMIRHKLHRWISRQQIAHGERSDDTSAALARFAADGAGMRHAGEDARSPLLARLHRQLVETLLKDHPAAA